MLKRNGLNRKGQMLYRSYLSSGSVSKLGAMQKIDKVKTNIETSHTVDLLGKDSFYLVTIKGIGSIYSQAVIDFNCNFSFSKLYKNKSSSSAVEVLKNRVIPF